MEISLELKNKGVWRNHLIDKRGVLFTAAIVAFILGLGYWLWLSPVVGAADVRVHIRAAWVFHVGLLDGPGYPDWDATAYGGRGNPMPRFLGPLPLALTSLLQLMGFEALTAVKILVAAFALFGLAGVYRWLAGIGHAGSFVWVAAFFMIHPLVSFHLGVAFLFQNLCTYFLSPWLWHAACLIWRGEKRGHVVGALVLGAIAMSHLYFALMIGYAWFFFMLAGWLKTRYWRFGVAAFGVPVLAMLLAAPYLLPAMLTTGDVYYEEVSKVLRPGKPGCEYIDEPVISENNQVLSWSQAVLELTESPDDGQAMSVLQMKSPGDRLKAVRPWLLLTLMLCFLLALAGSLRGDITQDGNCPPMWLWLLIGSGCAMLSLRFSSVIYSVLPGAMAVQFPFRWLLPAFGLWLPLVAVSAVQVDSQNAASSNPLFIAWFSRMLLVVILLIGGFFQSRYWTLPPDTMQSFFAEPGHLAPFYPRAVPRPRDVPNVAGIPHQLQIASGVALITSYQAGVAWFEAQLEAATPVELHINTHYDPCWRFNLSRTRLLQPQIDKTDGTMRLQIPSGRWLVTMVRESPPGRTLGWLLMLVALCLLAVVSCLTRPGICARFCVNPDSERIN